MDGRINCALTTAPYDVLTSAALQMPAKFLFMRLLRGTRHLTNSTKTHWVVWLSCVLVTLLFSYIVSSAIPVFSSLIGLVGAIFASLLCLHAEVRLIHAHRALLRVVESCGG